MTQRKIMSKTFEIEKVEKLNFNGEEILFAVSNGNWLNATKIAKISGKRLDKFWELDETKAYMKALEKSYSPLTGELKHTKKGRYGGTYIHPQLVLYFAQWISPEFHIKCNTFLEYQINLEANNRVHRIEKEKERVLHQHSIKMKELDQKREECEAKIEEYNKQMKEQKDLLIAATALESKPRKRKEVGEDKGFGSVRKWLQLRMQSGDIKKMSLREVFDNLESKEVRKVTHEKVVSKRYRVLDESIGEDTSSGINVDFAEMDKIFFSKARKHFKKTEGDKPEHKCKGECEGKGKCKNKPKADEVESKKKGSPVKTRVTLADKAKGNFKARKEVDKNKPSEAKPVKPKNKPGATSPKKK